MACIRLYKRFENIHINIGETPIALNAPPPTRIMEPWNLISIWSIGGRARGATSQGNFYLLHN